VEMSQVYVILLYTVLKKVDIFEDIILNENERRERKYISLSRSSEAPLEI